MWAEPFARPAEAGTSRSGLGLEVASSGIYARTSGPRVETRAEIRWLRAAGVSAVSQTCDPEIVLAGELGIAYGLVGFPVNYVTGAAEHETREELGRLLARSSEVQPGLVLRAMEILREEDLMFDHANVYRVDGGARPMWDQSLTAGYN
jgi:purine nucleoside phosphorylase